MLLGAQSPLAENLLQNFERFARNRGRAVRFASAMLVINRKLLVGFEPIHILFQKVFPERRRAFVIALPFGKNRKFSASDPVDGFRETGAKGALVESPSHHGFAPPIHEPGQTVKIQRAAVHQVRLLEDRNDTRGQRSHAPEVGLVMTKHVAIGSTGPPRRNPK